MVLEELAILALLDALLLILELVALNTELLLTVGGTELDETTITTEEALLDVDE